jgi:hypothetical protein
MATISMLGFGLWFCKPTKTIVGVGTLVWVWNNQGVTNHHCCCVETTSSNFWTCSLLSPLWMFMAYCWVEFVVSFGDCLGVWLNPLAQSILLHFDVDHSFVPIVLHPCLAHLPICFCKLHLLFVLHLCRF